MKNKQKQQQQYKEDEEEKEYLFNLDEEILIMVLVWLCYDAMVILHLCKGYDVAIQCLIIPLR